MISLTSASRRPGFRASVGPPAPAWSWLVRDRSPNGGSEFLFEFPVPPDRIRGRACPLLHHHVRAFALFAREVVDAVVDEASHAFQKLHARVLEVPAAGLRQTLLDHRQDSTKQAAGVRRPCVGGLLLFHIHVSFISTVRILFSNVARLGERAAIETGRPMCRRSVPISTTSSSPFLKRPTSPLTANGSRRRIS